MSLAATDEAGLEIEIRLVRCHLECPGAAVLAYLNRSDVFVPVLVGTQHHMSTARWISNAQAPLQDCFSFVQFGFCLWAHKWAPNVLSCGQRVMTLTASVC